MKNYLKLILSPSAFIDEQKDKKLSNWSSIIIWALALFGIGLPELVLSTKMTNIGYSIILFYLLIIVLYFPFLYGASYLYWIIGKGFKGVAKFFEIRDLMIYSMVPLLIYLPFSITFIFVGVSKGDISLIPHLNYLTHLILWIPGFRIFIIGIAKYNKFDWTISLLNWFIVFIVIVVFILLLKR